MIGQLDLTSITRSKLKRQLMGENITICVPVMTTINKPKRLINKNQFQQVRGLFFFELKDLLFLLIVAGTKPCRSSYK